MVAPLPPPPVPPAWWYRSRGIEMSEESARRWSMAACEHYDDGYSAGFAAASQKPDDEDLFP